MLKRLLACLICAALLLGCLPGMTAAHADTVSYLSLTLNGQTVQPDGSVVKEPLTMTFEVKRDGEKVGELETSGGAMLEVPGAGQLYLVPVKETVPEGWLIS